jgi:hypothetical protein
LNHTQVSTGGTGASRWFATAQSYVSAFNRRLKVPGATIPFRIAGLYGKSIEWLLTESDGEAPSFSSLPAAAAL